MLRQTFSVGHTKPNTKIHVFLYTEERIVRQHKRPSLHAFSAEIEQRNLGRYKRFSGFQFLCQLFRKLRPRRSFLLRQVLPRTASQGRNQLAERAGHGKHIGQAGIGDIHVRNSLKENLTGVFPVFLPNQLRTGRHINAGNASLNEIHHHDAGGRIGRTQRQVKHIDKLRVVLLHHEIHFPDIIAHLIGENQPDNRSNIGI